MFISAHLQYPKYLYTLLSNLKVNSSNEVFWVRYLEWLEFECTELEGCLRVKVNTVYSIALKIEKENTVTFLTSTPRLFGRYKSAISPKLMYLALPV